MFAAVLVLAGAADPCRAQTFNARRLAMGGVLLPGGGPGSEGANVAYRAVPANPSAGTGFTLPLGLLALAADPPVLDPDDPDFDLYEIANALYNPPWNLQLTKPDTPSDDITVVIARNQLSVDLGEVAGIFPDGHSRMGLVGAGPAVSFGVGRFFAGAATLVHYENDLSLNDALHGALTGGQPFTTNTQYLLLDRARGQVAAGLQAGWAAALVHTGDDPRAPGGSGLYVGARAKALRGLAYGDADNTVSFATGDTLFATNPVLIDYAGLLHDAGTADGRYGAGLDAGIVWVAGRTEVGVGVNDVVTRIGWRVRESLAFNDSATGDVHRVTLREGVPYTSRVPTAVTANVAVDLGPWLVAGDVTNLMDITEAHAGLERWFGPTAVRAGLELDANQRIQVAGGLGVRFGRFGLDAAAASHSRNLERERSLELALGVAFYR
jgi:hypothetical protein